MKNLKKTGIAFFAIAILSLVGFTTAFGYGGSCSDPINPPPGGFYAFNYGGPVVYNRFIALGLRGGDAKYFAVSNSSNFSGATIRPYNYPFTFWTLSSGYGNKTVWVRYYNSCQEMPETVSLNLTYHKHYGDGSIDDEINNIIDRFDYGDTDPLISTLQMDLKSLGFMPSWWTPTAHWGPYTDSGVRRYKASKGE